MNVLIPRPSELQGTKVVVRGERAKHLVKVLQVKVGDTVKCALVGKETVASEVLSADKENVVICAEALLRADSSSPRESCVLVLAMPRPIVLRRCIESAATLGFSSILITNSWRVQKSYFSSKRLNEEALNEMVYVGCEQGGHSHLPSVKVFTTFVGCRDYLAKHRIAGLVLHPHACANATWELPHSAMAVGPEGGFIDEELDTFIELGFSMAKMQLPILRVEQAVIASAALLFNR